MNHTERQNAFAELLDLFEIYWRRLGDGTVEGKVGNFSLFRAGLQSLIVAEAPDGCGLQVNTATALYNTKLGKTHCRVDGHSENTNPEEAARWWDSRRRQIFPTAMRSPGTQNNDKFVFIDHPEACEGAQATVDKYHIDNDVALLHFKKFVKAATAYSLVVSAQVLRVVDFGNSRCLELSNNSELSFASIDPHTKDIRAGDLVYIDVANRYSKNWPTTINALVLRRTSDTGNMIYVASLHFRGSTSLILNSELF